MKQLDFRPFIRRETPEREERRSRSYSRKAWRYRQMHKFLDALAKRGIVAHACKEAGIKSRRTVYRWYDRYEWFKEAFDAAIEISTEMAEAELYRRGVEGYTKPIAYKGEITALYREYSDACLRLLLQSRKPDVYRDRSENINRNEGQVRLVWNLPIPEQPTN